MSIPKECENIIQEYMNISNLLDGFYKNDVPFNINSLISTLRNINIIDMGEGYRSGVYYHTFHNDDDNDSIKMTISFAIKDTETHLSCEIACIEFNAIYVNRLYSSDVKILKLKNRGNFKC